MLGGTKNILSSILFMGFHLENAGTEQHCKDLASYFMSKGHRVSVIAATREIGKQAAYGLQEDFQNIPVWRIVNNIPTRPLSQGESSPQINNLVKISSTKSNLISSIFITFNSIFKYAFFLNQPFIPSRRLVILSFWRNTN